ncbi:uncharacterized protein TNCV_2800361 [Trichonephila clavipes]|nr:uncharacterized protein TNCV_2800361 [Trichonephila clavipes]
MFSSGLDSEKFRTYLGSLPIKVITDHPSLTHLTNGKNLSNRIIRWALKLAEFNIEWEHRFGTQNTGADALSRNPIESIIGDKVNCAIIRDFVLSSRDQLREGQRTNRKRLKQDKVAVNTNQYNLRPRGGREVESRPSIERKIQQGGPVRSRNGKIRNDNTYIVQRTRSSNRNVRRGGDQQRQDQERK